MNHSKNALAQALKIVNPKITKIQLLEALAVPNCRLASARYWEEVYNILPWHKRKPEEQIAALTSARAMIQ